MVRPYTFHVWVIYHELLAALLGTFPCRKHARIDYLYLSTYDDWSFRS